MKLWLLVLWSQQGLDLKPQSVDLKTCQLTLLELAPPPSQVLAGVRALRCHSTLKLQSRMMEGSPSPQGQHDPFTWFKESQLQAVFRNGSVPDWFHGIISRKTAEELLMSRPPGYFLIRVSESRIGYTLSYRADERCRHFMIDALVDGQYMIVGENRRHRNLQDLVEFHRRIPIMPFNQVLTVACGQPSNSHADYAQLLFPQRPPTSDSSLPPKTPPHPGPSSPGTEVSTPPALPYRPDNLRTSTDLHPDLSRLYPSLEEEVQRVTAAPAVSPVPKIRTVYAVCDPPPNQPPEVPSRSKAPLRQNQPCVRTVSSPGSPFLSPVSGPKPGTNVQPVKNQDWRPSVVNNLKSLKKKLQKKVSDSQENVYSEITAVPGNSAETPENEYQEIPSWPAFRGSGLHSSDVRETDQVLPQEYQSPPPFAPGY